jgi:hypothetical protein
METHNPLSVAAVHLLLLLKCKLFSAPFVLQESIALFLDFTSAIVCGVYYRKKEAGAEG